MISIVLTRGRKILLFLTPVLLGGALLSAAGLTPFSRRPTCIGMRVDIPIILSVASNPRTHVFVKHRGTVLSPAIDLGETPIEDATGVNVGDTVVLVNDEHCLSYEESIQVGETNEHRRIEKTFPDQPCKR